VDADVDILFESHGDVWEYIKDHWNKYRDVPSIDQLQDKFRDFDAVPITSPTQYYLDTLKNDYSSARLRDALLKAGQKLKDNPVEKVMVGLQSDLSEISKHTHNVRDMDLTDWKDAEMHMEAVRKRSDEMGGSPGIKTGFNSIDLSYPTGMAPGHYVVVIGYPSRGKTWFTAYLAVKAWQQGFKPMIVSAEMSDTDMRNRIYALMASGLFKVSDFQRGDVDQDEFRNWAKKTLSDKQSFPIVSNANSGGEITPAVIQAKIDQHKPDLVVCDYMQLLSDNRQSESLTPRMMNLSRELKLTATRNNIPVIAISAVTMDDTNTQDSPPLLSQVAWSKAIEYDADMAMSVHRHQDTDIIEVVSRKNRHGTEFNVYLKVNLNEGKIEESFDEFD
jgi:replicative DNA helicase